MGPYAWFFCVLRHVRTRVTTKQWVGVSPKLERGSFSLEVLSLCFSTYKDTDTISCCNLLDITRYWTCWLFTSPRDNRWIGSFPLIRLRSEAHELTQHTQRRVCMPNTTLHLKCDGIFRLNYKTQVNYWREKGVPTSYQNSPLSAIWTLHKSCPSIFLFTEGAKVPRQQPICPTCSKQPIKRSQQE